MDNYFTNLFAEFQIGYLKTFKFVPERVFGPEADNE